MAGVIDTSAVDPVAAPFFAWSRLFSPLAGEGDGQRAWSQLGLAGRFSEHRSDFWSTFHVGTPAAPVSLLLHSAIRTEGSAAREDWMRVIGHLGLVWADAALAPDHLAVASEVYGCAIVAREPMLVRELADRYLLPWCAAALVALRDANGAIRQVPSTFENHVRAARASAAVENAA